jgi:predicted PurR-regulated permease PerM
MSAEQVPTRESLARAIAIGGIASIGFAALLALAWYASATLFLLFAGILFGVFLNAMTNLAGKALPISHSLRLTLVCILLVAMFSGVVVLGGATIAQQSRALSTTIRSQISNVKDFLEERGVDTSFLSVGNSSASAAGDANQGAQGNGLAPKLPDAGAIASGTGAIVSQTFRIIASVFEGVGNFFVVVFLGLLLAAQPQMYRRDMLSFVAKRHGAQSRRLLDHISETLERWLIGQLMTMMTLFVVTWIGLSLIGIPGALVLGFLTGLLTFVPNVGAILAGFLIILASLGSGLTAVATAFGLYLFIQFLEGNVLTPLIQRHAIEIPPATLFAAQIFLGVLFGLWGLALALPVIAVAKVTINHFWPDEQPQMI